MCGIFGIISLKADGLPPSEKLDSAVDALSHRGPDDRGLYLGEGVALGHRRLSVIDLSPAAHQPMADATGRYHIVFNGEIFNYRELRNELLGQGVHFFSTSDTEVLLQLYINYGPGSLSRLNGFFALAIYDQEEQTMFIARDRLGIKPLYYYSDRNIFAFASETRALCKAGLPLNLDPSSIGLYLQLTYVPEPYSIYREVRRLQAGHYLMLKRVDDKWNEATFKEQQWYRISYDALLLLKESDYEETCKSLYTAMEKSVERRLVSDVPVGAFLSGGIDSSIITALASRHHRELHTFSVGYAGETHFDETAHAQQVARHCGTKHREYRFSMDDLEKALPDFLECMDEPFADSSALPVYMLSEAVRREVTVALSGDGSDELFAGYRKHRAEWLVSGGSFPVKWMKWLAGPLSPLQGSRNSRLGNRLRQLQRFAEGAGLEPQDRYWRWATVSSVQETMQLLTLGKEKDRVARDMENRKRELLPVQPGGDDFNQVLLNDCRMVLPGDMLVKVDRMSMAHGLEVRNPFLDKEVVELAFRMPVSFKINRSAQKRILRDTFSHLLPGDVFERPKQGFEVPLKALLLRKKTMELLKDTIEEGSRNGDRIFDPEGVMSLMRRMESRQPGDAPARIWSILVFQNWCNRQKRNSDNA